MTTNSPGREKRGTSSQPPAKSTRSGASVGACTQRTIEEVETGSNFGGVLGSTTYSAPTSAQSSRFKGAYFQRLHRLGLHVRLMIVTDQVERAVNDEMSGMIGQRNAAFLRLAGAGLLGEDDVAEQHLAIVRIVQ